MYKSLTSLKVYQQNKTIPMLAMIKTLSKRRKINSGLKNLVECFYIARIFTMGSILQNITSHIRFIEITRILIIKTAIEILYFTR